MLQKNEEKNKQDINVGYLYNEEHKPVVGVLGDRITLQPHLLQTRVVHKALLSKNRGDITLASGKVHNEVVHNVLTFKNPGRGWCTRSCIS